MIDIDKITNLALEILKSKKRKLDERIENLEGLASIYTLFKYAGISLDEDQIIRLEKLIEARNDRNVLETNIKKLMNLIESLDNPTTRAEIEEALKDI